MFPFFLTLIPFGTATNALSSWAYNESLFNVTILTTGGTIAESGSTAVQTTNYGTPNATFETLIAAVPDLQNVANLQGYQVANVDSQNINSITLLELHRRVTAELRSDNTQGVVITHGTDTLEETSFFLDLTTSFDKPIVLVAAMRPASALSADGPLNLYQAVKLAAEPGAAGRGPMVTLNDRIASAFYVSKNHANALDAFYAKEQGYLGFFLNQSPVFYYHAARPRGKPTFDIATTTTTTTSSSSSSSTTTNMTTLPMVDIIYAHIDANPALIEASVRSGARGLVFAGTGAGNLPQACLERARALHDETGLPMVFSSRALNGFVPPSTANPWQIPGADLSPQKARIMLQLAVATGQSLAEIYELFASLQQV